MIRTQRARRALFAATSISALALAALPGTAVAAPERPQAPTAPAVVTGTYASAATSALLDLVVGAIPLAGLTVADVVVGPNETSSNSELEPRSFGRARNLDASVLSADISALLLDVTDSAPPDDGPVTDTLLELPLEPVLSADVVNVLADANDAGAGACVAADTPLAESLANVANLTVLGSALPDLIDLPAGLTGDLVQISGDGAAASSTDLFLPSIPGPNDRRAVQSNSRTDIAGINILGGIQLEVAAPPTLTATVTGDPGGASVVYNAPVVTLRVGGNEAITLTANDPLTVDLGTGTVDLALIDALFADLGIALPVGTVLEDLLAPVVGAVGPLLGDVLGVTVEVGGPANVVASADGTQASGTVELVNVNITLFPNLAGITPITVLDLAVSPLAVTAAVSAGGLTCGGDNPLDGINKTSVAEVGAGDSFDYSITVPNSDDSCTLTDVRVSDIVAGPDGSRVTETDPAAEITGNGSSQITVVFPDIGPIPPGESRTLRIRVLVPANARPGDTYQDVLNVSALCDGTRFENNRVIDTPRVVGGVLARTGSDNTVTGYLVVGGLLGAALAASALRRRLIAV